MIDRRDRTILARWWSTAAVVAAVIISIVGWRNGVSGVRGVGLVALVERGGARALFADTRREGLACCLNVYLSEGKTAASCFRHALWRGICGNELAFFLATVSMFSEDRAAKGR